MKYLLFSDLLEQYLSVYSVVGRLEVNEEDATLAWLSVFLDFLYENLSIHRGLTVRDESNLVMIDLIVHVALELIFKSKLEPLDWTAHDCNRTKFIDFRKTWIHLIQGNQSCFKGVFRKVVQEILLPPISYDMKLFASFKPAVTHGVISECFIFWKELLKSFHFRVVEGRKVFKWEGLRRVLPLRSAYEHINAIVIYLLRVCHHCTSIVDLAGYEPTISLMRVEDWQPIDQLKCFLCILGSESTVNFLYHCVQGALLGLSLSQSDSDDIEGPLSWSNLLDLLKEFYFIISLWFSFDAVFETLGFRRDL